MTTRPMHDLGSIAKDAENVLAQAIKDAHDKGFLARLAKHELDAFAQKIEALKAGQGARTSKLEVQVEAGVHAAEARAAIVETLRDVRDDAVLAFGTNDAIKRAFGFVRAPRRECGRTPPALAG